jgi:glycosyltransferase involved in cell wall biosynthesis
MTPSPSLVCFSSEFPPLPGGIGNHTQQLLHALRIQGLSLYLLTDQRSDSLADDQAYDQQLGYPVERIPLHRRRYRMYIQRLVRLFGLMRRHPDRVFLASGKFPLWAMAVGRFLFPRRRCLLIVHGSEVNFPSARVRAFTQWCVRQYDAVIAVSHYTRSLLGPSSRQLRVVIPNGYDESRFRPNSPLPRFDPDQPLHLVTVGGVTQRKGQHNVIAALPLIQQRFPEVHYHIVGIPHEQKRLEALAMSLGVSACVTFHGAVSPEELLRHLSESHLFLMLSETTATGDTEGFGIALIEANAMGLPTIGSRNCGIEDAIHHGHSGVVVDPHDPASVAAAVETILQDYQHFQDAAIDWASRHRWHSLVQSYVHLIQTDEESS